MHVAPDLRGAETTGYLDDAALDSLLRGAAALVHPSLYEGFGLVLAEAMVRGVPVACADATALPTTSGSIGSVAPPAWVGYPSNCLWTASGPGGSRSMAVTLTTVAPPPPTVNVRFSSHPLTAGSPFSNTWTTTNATSLRYQCTAAGSGFAGSAQVAVNGTSGGVALYSWVKYPSSCVWTATGPGGSATFRHSIVTQYPIQVRAGR